MPAQNAQFSLLMNIVLLDADTLGHTADLSAFEQFGTFTAYPTTSPEELHDRIGEADILIVNKVRITEDAMQVASRLKLIALLATGMNNIDLPAAEARGIAVKNVAGYSTESVAQVTWAMLLHLLHHLPYFDAHVKTGAYSRGNLFTHLGRTFAGLHTLQLGIIGLGNIGEQVAHIAEAFGMRIAFHSPSGTRTHPRYTQLSLQALLQTSDVVSIHTPLTPTTHNLLDAAALRLMRKRAILLNTARGGIVDEQALADCLNAGGIAAAGFDVFEQEPLPANHPFLSVHDPHKLLLTPHIAWASEQARETLLAKVVENVRDFVGVARQGIV